MSLKLISPVCESLTVEVPREAEVSEEGLWSFITDSISYIFTSDSSVAEKLGNMCYWLDKMDEDQIKAFEATKVDRKTQTYQNMETIMRFSGEAVDFCIRNLGKYEGKGYALNDDQRKEINEEMEGVCQQFESSHNRNEIAGMIESEGAPGVKEPTYATLGFTHEHIQTLAKQFKNDQAGRLNKLRKMKFIATVTGVTPKGGKWEIVNLAARNFGVILKDAIKSYKYVDKFLYCTYQEMRRQKIITH